LKTGVTYTTRQALLQESCSLFFCRSRVRSISRVRSEKEIEYFDYFWNLFVSPVWADSWGDHCGCTLMRGCRWGLCPCSTSCWKGLASIYMNFGNKSEKGV
jgi:hypothetical protein